VREQFAELPVELRREDLVGAITSVGLFTCWTRFAIVNVLPEPVTPSSV
jgi:hypothetical protein